MIGIATSAIQMGLGVFNAIKANKEGKAATKAAELALSPLAESVDETRMMKNVTQGAGMAQAQAQARQSQADTMGQAGRQISDPTKLAGVASATNMQSLQAGQQRDAVTEQQRLQGQRAHVDALGRFSQGKMNVAQQKQEQAQNTATQASNLMGASLGNISGMAQDASMLQAQSDIDAGTFDSKSFMREQLFGNPFSRK